MKKILSILFFVLLIITACHENINYRNNKKVLDQYPTNEEYGILTNNGYFDKNKNINFKNLIDKKIRKDGKEIEQVYNTRYNLKLINGNVNFCYEYKRINDSGKYAIGYIDFETLEVYADYIEGERYSFEYYFSTDKYLCYKFSLNYMNPEYFYVVFFKETNKLEFNYDLSLLSYNIEDIEVSNLIDYYIEDDIKYNFNNNSHALIDEETGTIIYLPYENDILDRVQLLKEMYSKFSYDSISIYVKYICTQEGLFFYIHDRPTNKLNVPFMLFKCNKDLSNVEYICYSENTILDVIKL